VTGEPLRSCRFRFGVYELDARAGELWREGLPVHIPPQPFKVLWLLASRAGDVVTREEIRQELWGNDTFVDFDGGLNFCINQIRKALRDSAESPRFIHTLPRRGYRFIAAVERVPAPTAVAPDATASDAPATAVTPGSANKEEGEGDPGDGTSRPPRARASHLYEVVPAHDVEGGRRWWAAGGPGRGRLTSSPVAVEDAPPAEVEDPAARAAATDPRPEAASHLSSEATPAAPSAPAAPSPSVVTSPLPATRRTAAVTWAPVAVAMALVAAAMAMVVARRGSEPAYQRLTFRRGTVAGARFTPGGEIAYSASWEGGPWRAYVTRPGETASRILQAPERTRVQSVLASGEIAVLLNRDKGHVLGLLPPGGGTPRELVAGVSAADVSRDGMQVVVTRSGPENRIEMPPGREIYRAAAKFSSLRLSPQRGRVAFFEHPVPGDDRGSVVTLDGSGQRTALSEGWASLEGLAWSADGGEVWFTGAKVGADSTLNAVSLAGHARVVTRGPGRLVLHDLRADGAALLERTTRRIELRGRFGGEDTEKDLSWLDHSFLTGMAPDGRAVVFSESGEGAGAGYGVFLRPTDGTPPVRLGEGRAMGLSPDGRWVLSIPLFDAPRVVALPTGPGEPRTLGAGLRRHAWAAWFPDSARIAFAAAAPGGPLRTYVQDLAGGPARPVTDDVALVPGLAAPDGRLLTRRPGLEGEWHFHGLDRARAPERAPLEPPDRPLAFTPDGGALLVQPPWRAGPIVVDRVDLRTGARERFREVPIADPAGIARGISLMITADGRSYAYSANRHLSELYLVQGLD
jgi:DNA-binding winged helix-turn-helix (wHTH) protein